MRSGRLPGWALVAGLLAMQAACGKATPPHPATTIKELMEGEVNPAGEFLFKSVAQVSDKNGVHLKAPQTDAQWRGVRDQLMVLYNAPRVLMADGVLAAPPGTTSEHPGIESEPAEIQAAVDRNRPDFNNRALKLKSAADLAIKAVDAKDPLALIQALDGVDRACESCHLHYFYPKDERAQQAAKEDGLTN